MGPRVRFSLLLLTLTIFSSQAIFSEQCAPSQDAAAKKPPEKVQKVIYLSNIAQPTDTQDLVNALRAILDIQRVQHVIGSQIIIVSGTPEQVAMAEKLAAELDKDKKRFAGLGYRIDLKIQPEGDKKSRPRLYSLVTDPRQSAHVTIEKQPPPPVPNEAGSENKPIETRVLPDPNNARNIECHIITENERTIELSVDAAFASDAANEANGRPLPLLKIRAHVTVELDKPTVISRIDDPDGSYTVELTVTRMKEMKETKDKS
jgi:hypothetical protein